MGRSPARPNVPLDSQMPTAAQSAAPLPEPESDPAKTAFLDAGEAVRQRIVAAREAAARDVAAREAIAREAAAREAAAREAMVKAVAAREAAVREAAAEDAAARQSIFPPPAGASQSPSNAPRSPAGAPRSPANAPGSPAGAPRSPAAAPRSMAGTPQSPAHGSQPPAGTPQQPTGAPQSPASATQPATGGSQPSPRTAQEQAEFDFFAVAAAARTDAQGGIRPPGSTGFTSLGQAPSEISPSRGTYPTGPSGQTPQPPDPRETAVIRTSDAPTGLLPTLTPTDPTPAPAAPLSAASGKAYAAAPVVAAAGGRVPTGEDHVVQPRHGEQMDRDQPPGGYRGAGAEAGLGSRIRTAVRFAGELMITFGLVVLLFAGYQVFGNSSKVQDEQDALASQLDEVWNDPTVGPTAAANAPAAPGDNLVGRLYIPKFAKKWVVVDGVQPKDIRYAPGHYPETAKPGEIGNFAVAGHRIKKIFWRLDELESGDVIGVETRDSWYVYRVYNLEIVKPSAVQVVAPVPNQPGARPTKAVLTLTTCNPKYNNYQRLIVHAELAATAKRDPSLPDAGMPAEFNTKK
jgi:sortase A